MYAADVNYLSVLIASVVAMLMGALWYGPLFGKVWMAEVGKTEEELKENFNPAKTYTLAFIGHFVVAAVLANLMWYLEVEDVVGALHTAFWSWLGFTFATTFITGLFEDKKPKHLLINEGYHLAVLFVQSVIIVLWL